MTELLGKRISALRSAKGINQRQLAEKLNISPSAIGMYEQGRREPSLALIMELAEIYFPSQPVFFSPDVQPAQRQKIMLHCSN